MSFPRPPSPPRPSSAFLLSPLSFSSFHCQESLEVEVSSLPNLLSVLSGQFPLLSPRPLLLCLSYRQESLEVEVSTLPKLLSILSDKCRNDLATQTLLGAATMAREDDRDAGTLREAVTSKGGTTAAALNVFQAAGFQALVAEAMQAACTRADELANATGDA